MLHKIINVLDPVQKSAANALWEEISSVKAQYADVVARMEVDLLHGLGGLSYFERAKGLYKGILLGNDPSVSAYLQYWTQNGYLSANTGMDLANAVRFMRKISSILQSDQASAYRQAANISSDHNGQAPAILHRELFKLEEDGSYVYQELINQMLGSRKLISPGSLASSIFHNMRILAQATETLVREANLAPADLGKQTVVDTSNQIYINAIGELNSAAEITPQSLTALELEMLNSGRSFSLDVLRKIASFHDQFLHAKALDDNPDYDPGRIERYNEHFRLAIRQNRVYDFLKYHRDTGGLMVILGQSWTKAERSIQRFFSHNFPVDEHILQVVRVSEFLGLLYQWGARIDLNPERDFRLSSKVFYSLLWRNDRPAESLADYQSSSEYKILAMLPIIFKGKPIGEVSAYIGLVQGGNASALLDLLQDGERCYNLQAEIKALLRPLLEATVLLPQDSNLIEPILFQLYNAALFHDIAKGDTPVDHEIHGVKIAKTVLTLFGVPETDQKAISDLISKHNILNACRIDHCDQENPIFKLLASQVINPELLLFLTLADRIAGKLLAPASNEIDAIRQKAASIARSMTALGSDIKKLRARMSAFLDWRTTGFASDRKIVKKTLFEAVSRFVDNMGPLYQSLLNDRPHRVWSDYKAVEDYKESHLGKEPSARVDIHVRLAPILSAYRFETINNQGDPKFALSIIDQLVKHEYLGSESEELTPKGLALTEFSALGLDNSFNSYEPAILKQILHKKTDFQPHINFYGKDILGLSRGIDHFLRTHNLAPDRMLLYTGKDGTVVDRIVFRSEQIDQLIALAASLGGRSILDHEIHIDDDSIDYSATYQLSSIPFVESTNTQTIISIELSGENNQKYLRMLKEYFRRHNMNITFGEYSHIPGSGIPTELSLIEKTYEMKRGSLYRELVHSGFIDDNSGHLTAEFDPEQPLAFQSQLISAEASRAIWTYFIEITSPRTRIDFVAADQRGEHEIKGIRNDLLNLAKVLKGNSEH